MTRRHARVLITGLIVGSLSGCGMLPWVHTRGSGAPIVTIPQPPAPGTVQPQPDGTGGLLRPKAHWMPAQWNDLPGWQTDRISDWWPALWKSCQKPASGWTNVCAEVKKLGASWGQQVDDGFVRQWVQSQLQPWRVTTLEGGSTGLMTGYFEPLLEGRRQPDARFQYPLHRAPADLGQRKPYFSRTELETSPDGKAAVAGREVVYLADPLDVLLIQVQGSGRIRLQDELTAQGQPRIVRLAFAGHNDQPYQSVARWLVDQGAFTLEQASWPAIRNWAQANPARIPEMMRANPRVVFFREEALTDPEAGPLGAQGVPLTPGRSVAVDRESIPLGTPVWLDTTVPQPWSATPAPPQPLQRLVMAQDTGGAIIGAVRADFFWGWGDEALAQAGRTKQPLAVWVLWPRQTLRQ
ncbi:MAG TPA: MltA domain-containing protein [Aquabacterium sp.]|uniref:murein transglycosylase A n=1 Tax=Aquabacterium sp. TaxID=1872578 RepID=UPI002E3669BB|nr:MltA domain-containing protein [Aquabacterium sp.]HEX5356800.1 MltA domain-containing protein [Aquabacterium sp.]